jgi:hypothetical protein
MMMLQPQTKCQQQAMTPLKSKQTTFMGICETGSLCGPVFLCRAQELLASPTGFVLTGKHGSAMASPAHGARPLFNILNAGTFLCCLRG